MASAGGFRIPFLNSAPRVRLGIPLAETISTMEESDISGSKPQDDLREMVIGLQARLAHLERHLGFTPTNETVMGSGVVVQEAELEVPTPLSTSGPRLPSLGFATLMLAGAFLLRALTESRMVEATVGILLGLTYTLLLVGLAHHAARHGDRSRATLFGVATTLVIFPLVWETATRLHLLPPYGAVAIIAIVSSLGMGLSVHHRLRGLGWSFLLGATASLVGLYWATGPAPLFAALAIAFGAGTLWLRYRFGWHGPQWLAAGVADLLVFLAVISASQPADLLPHRGNPSPGSVIPLTLILVVVYLGGFTVRTMYQRREAGIFEILQSLGCLAAGYLGTVRLLHLDGGSAELLGWATLVAAIAGYGVAFAFVRRLQGRGRNFFYHAWLGLLLTLLGTAQVVPIGQLALLWAILGVTAAVIGGRLDRWTLRLHCAVYLVGAAVLTGMHAAAYRAFVAPASGTYEGLSGAGTAAWGLALFSYGLLAATVGRCELSTWRRFPRFIVALIVLTGAGSLIVTGLAGWLTDGFPGSGGALLAAVRTIVLALTTMGLAGVSRNRSVLELGWFVNPLLVLTALKLLLEDLRQGSPISLFFGFTAFGTALIVTSRLGRKTTPTPAPTSDGIHEA